ncbi:DUF4118 domain-containing protein [Schlesneria sp. T3-172]|uniref:ATP-binding protein n=1 Tax=Schlesneria sphaerica TaxID=3373610 RepID=UPI0037C8F1D4
MASGHSHRIRTLLTPEPRTDGTLRNSVEPRWSLASRFGRGMGYLTALLFVFLATILRMVLDPLLGEEFPFVPYLCAIVFSFYFGGLGPALMTMALGFIATGYFFLTPRGSVLINNLQSQIGGGFYLLVGGSTILLMEGMKAAQRRANHNEEELLKKQADLETEIRERREAQEAYVKLLRRMVTIQEVERRRISRELHDQCGQDLTALDIGLKIVEELIGPQNQSALQHLKSMHETLGRVSREVHDLALELRPPSLDDLGLNDAIKGFVESWGERTAIAVDFESRGLDDVPLAPEVETAVYRTVIEALTNVAKHAGVSRASVVLEIQGPNLILIVEDQGRGFDIDAQTSVGNPPQHLGLLGMRERLEAAGGTLEIESTPGAGTTIFARAPIQGVGETK